MGRSGPNRSDGELRHLLDPQRLGARVVEACSGSGSLPVTREVRDALGRFGADRDLDRARLQELFELDVLVTARLLHTAAQKAGRRLRSLRDIPASLGVVHLRRELVRIAERCRLVVGPQAERLRLASRHGVATSRLAALVAQQTPLPGELARLCGLLHDGGLSAGLALLDELWIAPEETRALSILVDVHEELGQRLARACGLPPDVALALAQHHDPFASGHPNPLAAILCVADRLATALDHPPFPSDPLAGRGLRSLDQSGAPVVLRARRALNIGDAAWAAVLREAPGVVAGLT